MTLDLTPRRPTLRTRFLELGQYDPGASESFDAMLACGWNRVGPLLLRMPIGYWSHALRPVVDIRVPLAQYAPSPNQRRLLARNRRRFRVSVGRPRSWGALETLYRAQTPRFSGARFASLAEFMAFSPAENPYPTRLLSVWHGGTRIAGLLFDVGHHGAYGVLSLHDPAYSRFSVGWYALLELLAYLTTRKHFHHFYPGYVMLGVPLFDYKLRLRPLEHRGGEPGQESWLPYASLVPAETPAGRMERSLADASTALASAGVPAQRVVNAWFALGCLPVTPYPFSPFPAHLDCGASRQHPTARVALGYDPVACLYAAVVVRDDPEARRAAASDDVGGPDRFGSDGASTPAWCILATLYFGRSSEAALRACAAEAILPQIVG